MQAIIMAAGFGSRIAKLTDGAPKSFLKIGNERLIERSVRLLRERGIDDITIVTGYRSELFINLPALQGCKFVFNPLFYCTNVLASYACGSPQIEQDFIFLHADTIFDPKILDSLIAEPGEIVLPVDFKLCVEEEMKVTTSQDGRIRTISKEIPLATAEGEFIGLAKISKSCLASLEAAVQEELQEKKNLQAYFEAALQNMIDKGQEIISMPTDNCRWIEIDFPEDYEWARANF